MIVAKKWRHYDKYGHHKSTWKGIFLFGFIPLYLARIEVVL